MCRNFTTVAALGVVAGRAAAQSAPAARVSAPLDSVHSARNRDLAARIVDQRTRGPLRLRTVTMYSYNGRRCLRTPCTTNGEQWEGRTDSAGVVILPARLRQKSIHLWVEGYSLRVDLHATAVRRSADSWDVALRRNRK